MPKMEFNFPEEFTEIPEDEPVVTMDKEGEANEIVNYLTNTTFEIKKNKI